MAMFGNQHILMGLIAYLNRSSRIKVNDQNGIEYPARLMLERLRSQLVCVNLYLAHVKYWLCRYGYEL